MDRHIKKLPIKDYHYILGVKKQSDGTHHYYLHKGWGNGYIMIGRCRHDGKKFTDINILNPIDRDFINEK